MLPFPDRLAHAANHLLELSILPWLPHQSTILFLLLLLLLLK
jgi:hypothetical protein